MQVTTAAGEAGQVVGTNMKKGDVKPTKTAHISSNAAF